MPMLTASCTGGWAIPRGSASRPIQRSIRRWRPAGDSSCGWGGDGTVPGEWRGGSTSANPSRSTRRNSPTAASVPGGGGDARQRLPAEPPKRPGHGDADRRGDLGPILRNVKGCLDVNVPVATAAGASPERPTRETGTCIAAIPGGRRSSGRHPASACATRTPPRSPPRTPPGGAAPRRRTAASPGRRARRRGLQRGGRRPRRPAGGAQRRPDQQRHRPGPGDRPAPASVRRARRLQQGLGPRSPGRRHGAAGPQVHHEDPDRLDPQQVRAGHGGQSALEPSHAGRPAPR